MKITLITIKQAIELLKGKKSYIVGVTIALYSLLQSFEIIKTSPEQDLAVFAFLGALFGMAIRAGISK